MADITQFFNQNNAEISIASAILGNGGNISNSNGSMNLGFYKINSGVATIFLSPFNWADGSTVFVSKRHTTGGNITIQGSGIGATFNLPDGTTSGTLVLEGDYQYTLMLRKIGNTSTNVWDVTVLE